MPIVDRSRRVSGEICSNEPWHSSGRRALNEWATIPARAWMDCVDLWSNNFSRAQSTDIDESEWRARSTYWAEQEYRLRCRSHQWESFRCSTEVSTIHLLHRRFDFLTTGTRSTTRWISHAVYLGEELTSLRRSRLITSWIITSLQSMKIDDISPRLEHSKRYTYARVL